MGVGVGVGVGWRRVDVETEAWMLMYNTRNMGNALFGLCWRATKVLTVSVLVGFASKSS